MYILKVKNNFKYMYEKNNKRMIIMLTLKMPSFYHP